MLLADRIHLPLELHAVLYVMTNLSQVVDNSELELLNPTFVGVVATVTTTSTMEKVTLK